jgi:hypothetical protein
MTVKLTDNNAEPQNKTKINLPKKKKKAQINKIIVKCTQKLKKKNKQTKVTSKITHKESCLQRQIKRVRVFLAISRSTKSTTLQGIHFIEFYLYIDSDNKHTHTHTDKTDNHTHHPPPPPPHVF